jgi:hypothetical protein
MWQIAVWHANSGKEQTYNIDECIDSETRKPMVPGVAEADKGDIEMRVMEQSGPLVRATWMLIVFTPHNASSSCLCVCHELC